MRRILCWLLPFTFLLALPLCAAQRGVKRVVIKTQAGETVGLYEENHALVIGVSDYTAGWPDLESVVRDVDTVPPADFFCAEPRSRRAQRWHGAAHPCHRPVRGYAAPHNRIFSGGFR